MENDLLETDVRKIVGLLGEVIALPGSHVVKKRHLMDGLCALIGGDAWAWSLLHFEEDLAPRQVLMLHGGFDPARLAKWAMAIEHPSMKPVTGRLVNEAMTTGRSFTRKSSDFVPKCWWDSDDNAFLLWQDANIRSFLLSAWPLSGGGFSGIGIYRNGDRPQFDCRECRIAHILLSEIPWLHGQGLAHGEGRDLVSLHPRHRTILNLLVQGWERKKIAEKIGISLNTVHGYARIIFKHFAVHTQSELIARFTTGDGRDR